MELYLIRHTRPGIASGICYGQAEIRLADSFADEAAAVRAKLAGVTPEACYSSPSLRCASLAEQLQMGEPRHDARLLELSFGAWEMRAWDDIPRQELDRWGEAFVEQAPPGGESFAQLHRRAAAFLRALRHDGAVLAVTHAGVIRALLAETLDMPLRESFRFRLDYGGVTQLLLHAPTPSVGFINR